MQKDAKNKAIERKRVRVSRQMGEAFSGYHGHKFSRKELRNEARNNPDSFAQAVKMGRK